MENTETKQALVTTARRPTLILDPGGKGGVGKSTAITALADCLEYAGRKIKIYDAETKRSRTARVFGDDAVHYDIKSETDQAKFLASLEIDRDADVVLHDTGGSYDLDQSLGNTIGGGPGALSRLFSMIDDMGWDVTLFHVLTGSPETAYNIGRWLDVLENEGVQNVRHVVCLNQHYAPTEDACSFWMGVENLETGKVEGGNTRRRIEQLKQQGSAVRVILPKIHPTVAGKIEVFGIRYSKVMTDKRISIGERIQVKAFFDTAHESFAGAGHLLGFPDPEVRDVA